MTFQQLSPRKKYLIQLASSQNKTQINVEDCISEVASKVQYEIHSGSLNIPKKSEKQRQLMRVKLEKNSKDIENLNRQLVKNEEMLRKAKRQMMMQKKQQTEQQKKINEEKKKEIEEKIKKWGQAQKEIKNKLQEQQKIRQERQQEEEERIKKQEEERIMFQKLEKKKMIEKKLRQIDENKSKRLEILRQSSLQNKNLTPRYIQIQKRFKQYEQELKFQEEIAKKNHKIQIQLNHEAIKQHEKAFLQSLQSRKSAYKMANQLQQTKKQKQFNPFFSKDEQKKIQDEQKKKRRQKYAKKVKKSIPVIIDEAKKVKVQIEIDRGKNPLKYNFLNQKALNNFQIYGEFQQFQLNTDPRQIGKQYLKQLPSINQNSRIKKSRSTSNMAETEKIYKSRYIDYLQELKTHRTIKTTKTGDEIQGIIKNHKRKERAFSDLQQKMKKYDIQAKRKLQQKQKYHDFRSDINKNKEIDEIYLKSIKTKLACLQMKV